MTTLDQPGDRTASTDIDPDKVGAFVGRFLEDMATAFHVPTVLIGDRLGLYEAMANAEALTAPELAERTGTDERYITEWLAGQAAAGYVDYEPSTESFTLPAEHALVLTDRGGPVFIPGAYQVVAATIKDEPAITEAFRTGRGVGWDEHHPDLFEGTERFFRPGYNAHLVAEWLPALDGVEARLREGGSVADMGCGHGASTVMMAQAFPASTFVGFDVHEPSIEAARRAAERSGVADRVRFEVAAAKAFGESGYDLVTSFDCIHDMGDPVGAAAHVRSVLAPGGTWMIVEPFAHDRLEDNLTPVGKAFYNASTLICTPASRSQEVGLALGAQSGEARMRAVVTEGGFEHFRRVAETPVNIVYEARVSAG